MKAGKNPHLLPDTFYTAPLDTWAAAIQRLPFEATQCTLEQIVHYKARLLRELRSTMHGDTMVG